MDKKKEQLLKEMTLEQLIKAVEESVSKNSKQELVAIASR